MNPCPICKKALANKYIFIGCYDPTKYTSVQSYIHVDCFKKMAGKEAFIILLPQLKDETFI